MENNVDKTLIYIILCLTLSFLHFNYLLSFLQNMCKKVNVTLIRGRREYKSLGGATVGAPF